MDPRLLSHDQRKKLHGSISRVFAALRFVVDATASVPSDEGTRREFNSARRELLTMRHPIVDLDVVKNWITRLEGMRGMAIVHAPTRTPLLDSAIAQLKLAHGVLSDHWAAADEISLDPRVHMLQEANYGADKGLLVSGMRDAADDFERACRLL